MIYLIPFLVFMTFLSIALIFKERGTAERIDVLKRLSQVTAEEAPKEARKAELKVPLSERVLKPLFARLARALTFILPAGVLKNLEPKLSNAGNPGNLTPGEFLTIKATAALLAFFIAFLLLRQSAWLSVLFSLAGWYLPEIYLKMQVQKRFAEIEKTLPNVIDLLTISVEAGLGFDGALSKVVEKSDGILASEFKRVLQENSMGKKRREALKDMAKRLGEENITVLVNSIIQAEQLGISFSKVLRVQSEQVRYKRRQRVEEAAMKVPIKMLIPLVFFIFPTIFIVLLGPAGIRIFMTLTR